MMNDTYEKLFDLSYRTEERLVTPFILDYFNLEINGFKENEIIGIMENKSDINKRIKESEL